MCSIGHIVRFCVWYCIVFFRYIFGCNCKCVYQIKYSSCSKMMKLITTSVFIAAPIFMSCIFDCCNFTPAITLVAFHVLQLVLVSALPPCSQQSQRKRRISILCAMTPRIPEISQEIQESRAVAWCSMFSLHTQWLFDCYLHSLHQGRKSPHVPPNVERGNGNSSCPPNMAHICFSFSWPVISLYKHFYSCRLLCQMFQHGQFCE